MSINSPIRKLLVVSINQFDLLLLTICNLIYNFFDRAHEVNIYETKSRRLRSQKVVGTEKIEIGNLEDLLKVVFIDEECWDFEVVIVILALNQKKKSEVLRDKCTAGEGISSISIAIL